MNKRKLQEFATWAKLNLEKQINSSLHSIGIYSDSNIKKSRIQGDLCVIDGIEKTFKYSFHGQREQIVNLIRTDGFDHTVESFAYTWFNRLVALRFMEIHDYIEHGFKLFPTKTNPLPEILSKLEFVKEDLNLNEQYYQILLEGSKTEDLYRYVLFQQCKVLANSLPMLFSRDNDYLEYFIPTPLLFGESIIKKLIEIDEEDFIEDVEIIGWLYQFYIAIKKDEVFATKKAITKDTLPAVTQLFTPDWIVKYMVENSIGRIWLESYPSSPLRNGMKFYIEETEQEMEVEKELRLIRYKNLNPEEIKIIEPACGSGHILVYCFDLLLRMYLEKGYSKKDIPELILRNNLVGLDIDQRASQLASFALVMRARSIDNRFFENERYVRPQVFEITDSKAILHCNYNGMSYKDILRDYNSKQWQGENQLTNNELNTIYYLVDLFDDAKVIGSLLKVNQGNFLVIRTKLTKNFKEKTQPDIFTDAFFEFEFRNILEILRLAHLLTTKFDVMITNPPYCGITGLEVKPKNYLTKNYPNSKTDMFAMFMETGLIKDNGFLSMINMHSWMFLASYEKMRNSIIKSSSIINMIQLGVRAFDEINGEVVQTTSFVLRNCIKNYRSTYFDVTNYKSSSEKELAVLNLTCKKYLVSMSSFIAIPGSPISYWVSPKIFGIFKHFNRINDYSTSAAGVSSGDNEKYLKLWYEVNFSEISFNSKSQTDFIKSNYKYVPCNKGGNFRKWYGNNEYVARWDKSEDFHRSGSTYQELFFSKGITWSAISFNDFNARFYPDGFIFDHASPSLFANNKNDIPYLLGLVNSKVANSFLRIINPTINTGADVLRKIPYINTDEGKLSVIDLVNQSINISKFENDCSELSWDFLKHPLISSGKLSTSFDVFSSITKSNFDSLKIYEEKLNEHFINLYNLQDELSSKVDDTYISISIANKSRDIKSLISYFIGVLMGRYSLVEDGLINASSTFERSRYGDYDVDEDGIIPIYSDLGTENSLVHRLVNLVKLVYGNEYYRENIDFIAESLGKKSNETSEETLNRYLNDDFYADHLKLYQKRPIYWMFSSGKSSGFKCLVYLHRYSENTLAKINAGYFQPATIYLRNQISEIARQTLSATDKEKVSLERKRLTLEAQLNEAREYGLVLDNMANQYINIDLDDGVKVNYSKFQGIEIPTSNGKIIKDLLIPIK